LVIQLQKNVDNIDKDNLLQYIIPKDIKDFGLIPNHWSFAGIDSYGSIRQRNLKSYLTQPKML
jgi:ATP-dependent Clp protease ATP-binding subunit ClpX